MTSYLLGASVVFLSYLSLYALVFFSLGLLGIFRRSGLKQLVSSSNESEVCVLIPSYNEGEGLIDAIGSVWNQDYRAYIEVRVIVNDKQDNSISYLLERYNLSPNFLDDYLISGEGMVISHQGKRCLKLVLSGLQTKKDKINQALTYLDLPYIGLLDADHRPSPNWLSSSVSLCSVKEDKTAGVQTRRQPLDISHLTQIWDSAQNHLGNELVNNVLSSGGVFFTGTAAIFKTDVFKRFGLSDSITEDTYLSYDLQCSGYRVVYNNQASSYEEVAPSFLAYISRRRRWAAGHNQSFFSHLSKILRAKISCLSKLVLFIHGQFYLVPLVVWLLLSVYGYYFFHQLAANLQLATILISLSLSLIMAYIFRSLAKSWLRFISEWLVAMLWISPQIAIWAVYLYKLIGSESYYYILIFPYANDWLAWHLALIIAPLFALLGAWLYFRDMRHWLTLWVIPTYFFTLFFDIYAALLGFVDYLFGRAHWSKIERRNSYSSDLVPEEVSGNLVTGQKTKGPNRAIYFLVIVVIATVVLLNDLLAVNNCGRVEPFLWSPLIFKPDVSLDLNINFSQEIVSDGFSRTIATASIIEQGASNDVKDLRLKTYLDGEEISDQIIKPGLTTILDREYPLGWDKHSLEIELSGEGIGRLASCHRQADFATVIKELRGSDLYINNEKFLVKGLIPSFSNNQINLDVVSGLRQIKEAGANSVRFYHRANANLLQQAAAANLLVIDQPDRSTWDELDLSSDRQVRSYLDRYKELVIEHAGEPFILWDGLGNEWELGSRQKPGVAVTQINNLIKSVLVSVDNPLSSYSTYYTFINYPVKISGINMLDTGQTYWDKALALLRRSGRPFYASEFGGFVAFWEKTDPEIRLRRLIDEWDTLLKAGAVGANFYQSHDNWAQPVVTGYNDPWQAEQPDDLRGFWDEKNKAKPELAVLTQLLSDISIEPLSPIEPGSNILHLELKNIRPYRLSNVKLGLALVPDNSSLVNIDIGDLSIGEKKDIEIALPTEIIEAVPVFLRFQYNTHSGLVGISRTSLILPIRSDKPLVLNLDFAVEDLTRDKITGRLIYSNKLNLLLPASWQSFSLNGKDYKNDGGLSNIDISNPYQAVDNLELSLDGRNWSPFTSYKAAGGGNYYLRFNWPSISADKQSLVLSGIGAAQVKIDNGGQVKTLLTHNYRENLFRAEELGWPKAGDVIIVSIDRQQAAYISQAAIKGDLVGVETALSSDLLIDIAPPVIFAPTDIKLERIE